MNTLPNDILEIIYGMKHAMEMKEVCRDIENIKQEEICYLHDILTNYEYDNNTYFYEPEKIVELVTILRNEGEFDDSYLIRYIDNITYDLHSFHNIIDPETRIIDKEFYVANTFINTYWYFMKYQSTQTVSKDLQGTVYEMFFNAY